MFSPVGSLLRGDIRSEDRSRSHGRGDGQAGGPTQSYRLGLGRGATEDLGVIAPGLRSTPVDAMPEPGDLTRRSARSLVGASAWSTATSYRPTTAASRRRGRVSGRTWRGAPGTSRRVGSTRRRWPAGRRRLT